MIPALRQSFNKNYSPAKYQAFLDAMDARLECHVKYRQSETPCFFTQSLLDELAVAGRELVEQLLTDAKYMADSKAIIPPEFDVPNEAPHPMFVQADFGLARNAASSKLEPKLVEIQGFPSLYGYQPHMGRQYIETYGLDPQLRYLMSGLTDSSYKDLVGRAILNGYDPENVILMEIDPENQKTLPDFKATRDLLGIPYVCITKLKKEANKLYYEKDGRRVPVHRIYNRVIVDELMRLNIRAPFDWRHDLQVEWAGHPNWFFRLSKFSIPYFRHASVPRTWFLSDVQQLPEDLQNYVLKPLYSFAGLGVSVGPSKEDIDAVPQERRKDFILQERVNFEGIIESPYGPTKAEIRVMFVWLDKMIPVTTIIRMARGKMMGVDHNKNMEWVGGSAGLYLENT